MSEIELLPNLGAEEGDDWRAFHREPYVRVAARLWSHLYSDSARFRYPPSELPSEPWDSKECAEAWPAALGPSPSGPVFPWLEDSAQPTAWLNTPSVEASARNALGQTPSGPASAKISRVHDKAFAIETARNLGLHSSALDPLIQVLEPEAFTSPDALVERLDTILRSWPEWLEGDFTLKPRFGSSGRGRVAGRGTTDTPAIRGALPRLAKRGGAILEPWLDRQADLSVSLHIPAPAEDVASPTILGSLEMLASRSGVFRGHCGEVDSRGRIFSGHRQDETLRGDAAAVAGCARAEGFYGVCGVDAFTYQEPGGERLRGLVEFNARATMGLVTIGLVRRALPRVRSALELSPGERRGFLMGFFEPGSGADRVKIESLCTDTIVIDLASPNRTSDPQPFLMFGPDRATLRQAHLAVLGC